MDDRINLGNPLLSELIEKLKEIKNEYGDIPTVGAYDGNWSEDVQLFVMDGTLIIGSIS